MVGSKQKWTDKTLRQMVKVVLKLNRQKHKMKHTLTFMKSKKKREKTVKKRANQ